MAIVPAYPFNLLNGTVADATQVMADFDNVRNSVISNAAANGANSDITSLNGLTTPLSVAQGGTGTSVSAPGPGIIGMVGGYRNILRRNGGMEIWQRGAGGSASIAVPASSLSGVYTVDGWYLNTGSSEACTVSQQAGLTSPSQFCAKVQRNSGQTGTGILTFGFPLDSDELYPMLGQFIRLSFTAKAGTNFSAASNLLIAQMVVGTGAPAKVAAGFTGTSIPFTFNNNLTTTATRYQVSSAAIIPITTRQAEINFSFTPVGTASADDSYSIDSVQIELVPAATGYVSSDFERLNFEEQLLLCQRHFNKSFLYSVAPAAAAGVGNGEYVVPCLVGGASPVSLRSGVRHPIPMRGAPTITLYNTGAAGSQAWNQSTSVSLTGTTSSSSTNNGFFLSGTGDAGSTVGNILSVQYVADAGI